MRNTKKILSFLIACSLLLAGSFTACKKDDATLAVQNDPAVQESVATVPATETVSETETASVSAPISESDTSETSGKPAKKPPVTQETTTRRTKPTTTATTLPALSQVPKGLLGGWCYREKIPPTLLFNGGFLEELDFQTDWEVYVICFYYEDGSYFKHAYSWDGETYLKELTDARLQKAERENGAPLSAAQKERLSSETREMLNQMEDAESQKGTYTANDTTIFYTVRGQKYTESYKLSGDEITVTASNLSPYGLPRTMYRYNK